MLVDTTAISNRGQFFGCPPGAREVHAAIRDKYASMGWDRSYLRYPTTDEIQGEEQMF